MADAKTQLSRDGTMQVTAKEGIEYLEANKKFTLLEAQGLNSGDKGAEAGSSETPEKPKLAKAGTMAVTAKEGNELLGDNKPDADALTRGQQKQIEKISAEPKAESPAKKPRISKDTTMIGTAKEAKALLGNEKLGDTRQETKAKQKKTPVKRETTMARTAKEAQDLVGDVGGGRRTRSQSRGDSKPSPPKRAGTMQATAKEGKDFLKRSKKAKKEVAAEEEAADGDKKEDEDEPAGEEEDKAEKDDKEEAASEDDDKATE